MLDWFAILNELGLAGHRAGKNTARGCVSMACPFCGDHSDHGNFNARTGRYKCWRCGPHPSALAASRASGVPVEEVRKAMRRHDDGVTPVEEERPDTSSRPPLASIPGGTLQPYHIKYLRGRGFRAQQLVARYGIKGTGPSGTWRGHDYAKGADVAVEFPMRIIIPIHDIEGRLVNFQGRDVTGKQKLRYKGCPVDMAATHHKHLLYGAHLCRDRRRIVVVEGVFDQWRMGPGSVCTFGTSLTREQVRLLSLWEEVLFCFDPEYEAQERARGVALDIAACGRKVWLVRNDCGLNADGEVRDPGDLSQAEADALMRELMAM